MNSVTSARLYWSKVARRAMTQLTNDHLEAVNIGLVVVNVIWGGGKLECKDNMGAIMGHTYMRAGIKILADRGGLGVLVQALGGGCG